MKTRLIELMGQKQTREKRVINASTVARETGLTRQVISKWVRGEVTEFREDMIDTLCRYFRCGLGDLLYLDPDPRQEAEPEPQQN